VLDDDKKKEIEVAAQRILLDKQNLMSEMKRICRLSSIKLLVCALHKGKDSNIGEYCHECGGECHV
jgi:hypothetical protein